ncbi:MAG TPA: hypothetical protein VMU50_16285 [Polyangia bacterium]|nr:hypothetical protein [Polyangia bacterium]
MRSARAALPIAGASRSGARLAAAAALVGAAAMGATTAHAGDPPIRLAIDGDTELPFSSDELRAAVDARLPLARGAGDADAVLVRVSPARTPGRVLVAGIAATVDVPTAGKPPAEAARLVALAVVDVTRAAPRAPDAAATIAARPPAAPAARVGGRFAAALYPGASTGLGGGAIAFEPTADLSLGLGGAGSVWRLGLSVGFARASASWMDSTFTLSTLPLRLGARWRWRRIELGGGAVARLYDTGGLDGGRGAMLGGFASVGTSGPLAGRIRWTVLAAGDAYREQTVFRAAGQPVLSSGPLVFWLGVGAAFGGAS